MPTTYACDHCHTTSSTLDGWLLVAVQFYSMNPSVPTPPGGRTFDGQAPELLFDTVECRDAWCAQAAITAPPAPVTPV